MEASVLGLANQILDCTDIDWCGDDGVVVCRAQLPIISERGDHVASSIHVWPRRMFHSSLCHAPLSCALLAWVPHAAAACGREKRNEALVALQTLFQEHRGTPNLGSVFTIEVFRCLKLPLQRTLKDLRSTIAREACKVLEVLSTMTGDTMRPLIRELLPTLIELLASGNKVIQGYVGDCMVTIIKHTRFRQGIAYIVEQASSNKSKDVRDSCVYYIYEILSHWSPSYIEKDIEMLQNGLKKCLEDSSAETRSSARSAFTIFEAHWPSRAALIAQAVDARTARMLVSARGTAAGGPAQLQLATAANASPKLQAPGKKTRPTAVDPRSTSSSCNTAVEPSPDAATAIQVTAIQAVYRAHSVRRRQSTSSDIETCTNEIDADARANKPFEDPVESGAKPVEPVVALALGDAVMVLGRNERNEGTVRFVGETRFATGTWVGVELHSDQGKNDGSVQDISYFKCAPLHGLFVRPNMVQFSVSGSASASASTDRASSCPPPCEESSQLVSEVLTAHKLHVAQALQALRLEMQALALLERGQKSVEPTTTDRPLDITTYVNAIRERHVAQKESMTRLSETFSQLVAGPSISFPI